MDANYQLLAKSFTQLGLQAPLVTLTNAAFGSAPGWVKFPTSRPGDETLGLTSEMVGGPNELPVPDGAIPLTTLDQYAEQHNIDMIDWLSIDTEGNDARVIIGGSSLFAAQRIRLLEFEAHIVRHWAQSDLQVKCAT